MYNLEKAKATARTWYKNNKEKVKVKTRSYYKNNREELLVKKKKVYRGNKEKIIRLEMENKILKDIIATDPVMQQVFEEQMKKEKMK